MSVDLKRKSNEGLDEIPCKKLNEGKTFSDENISELMSAIQKQPLGNLVIIAQDSTESPFVTLQNSLACLNANLVVLRDDSDMTNFQLQINGAEYARDTFQNIQMAKRGLAEKTLKLLKDTCFFIYKKKDYVNVTKENLNESTSSVRFVPINTGSIAHKMMMKMGWAGGGLGAQEQGNIDSVLLVKNVDRQGFGSKNLHTEITRKLDKFSRSDDVLTLVFNSDFSKEERALIHKIARKFNLKSKSTGSESRKLAVSKKLTRMNIVRELLRNGGEDGLYKLHIPRKFEHVLT